MSSLALSIFTYKSNIQLNFFLYRFYLVAFNNLIELQILMTNLVRVQLITDNVFGGGAAGAAAPPSIFYVIH